MRAALPGGFDPVLWTGLAELGAFAMRVPEAAGGLGLGLLDATVFMEEAGRTLASGPVAEAIVATRLLAILGGGGAVLEQATRGEAIVTLALHNIVVQPVQWVAGGAIATMILARADDEIVLITAPDGTEKGEDNLGFTPIAKLDLAGLPRTRWARQNG